MNQFPNSELEIESLRAQLELAKRQIHELQNSTRQPPSIHFDAHGDTQLSVVSVNSPGSTLIARTASGKSRNRHHVDLRTSHPYQNGDGSHPPAVKRPRTMSQQTPSSQRMDRAASNLSTRSAGPFTGSSPVSPPPTFQATGLHAKHGEQGTYLGHNNLVASQPFASSIQQIPANKQQQRLCTLAETGPFHTTTSVLVDPADWLAAHEDPMPDLVISRSDMDVSNLNMSVSVCESMTSGPTWDNNTAPMTRQNSQFDNHPVDGGVCMMNVGSQTSQGIFFPENSQQIIEYGDSSLFPGKQPSHEHQLLAVGSNLTLFEGQYVSSAYNEGIIVSSDMERSLSSTSTSSAKSMSSSLSARAKVSLARQNHHALNAPLKPKPSADENKPEPPSDDKNDGKAVIAKTKYIRPRQPKVFCDQCNEHKEGFRGEHELRRHKDAKHQTHVKKFICVDPQEHGLPVNVQVVNPLSKCKACKAQKKYGAYYNAAAHLRRTHFKEKPSRSKNKNSGTNGGDDDKRGGKGGGDWPSMHELKNWMQEIYVRQDEQQLKEEEDADDDIDNTQLFFGDAEVNPGSSSSFAPTGMTNLDYGFASPLTINTINTDMAYMTSMPLSSADFTFNSPTMPLTINADVTAYSAIDHMNPLSSTMSSSATVTPLTAFNEQHHFDNVSFQYTA
ncbi:hypothetical protein EV127DRAFT_250503 [Xylaria flabelliformis]|nr:hypothetical protein EV127DRAFT_250503 [Xylaria flabelliformis]